jgi:hypothetical protein
MRSQGSPPLSSNCATTLGGNAVENNHQILFPTRREVRPFGLSYNHLSQLNPKVGFRADGQPVQPIRIDKSIEAAAPREEGRAISALS